jgi:hypothetical protein
MALNVFSAVVIADTRFQVDPNLNNRTIAQKCDFLEACATHAWAAFSHMDGGPPSGNDLCLLAAPEYFFGLPTSDAHSSVKAYDEAAHDEIVRRCAAISGNFPGMLMMPGTLLFKQRLTRDQREQMADHMQAKLDKRVATQVLGAQGTDSALVRQGRAGIANVELKGWGLKEKLGMRDPRLFGYNRAYVYFNGRKIKQFNKSEDAQEFSSENPKPTMVPGLTSGVFHYPNTHVRIGLEICADAGRVGSTGKEVDIRVILSAALPVGQTYLPTDDSKLLIHAKGHPQGRLHSGAMHTSMGTMLADMYRSFARDSPVANNLRCQKLVLNVNR